jgi:hypothetical protein
MRHMDNWRKSSLSFACGNCTEVASDSGLVGVRDSIDRGGPSLAFTAAEWRRFGDRIRGGLVLRDAA